MGTLFCGAVYELVGPIVPVSGVLNYISWHFMKDQRESKDVIPRGQINIISTDQYILKYFESDHGPTMKWPDMAHRSPDLRTQRNLFPNIAYL